MLLCQSTPTLSSNADNFAHQKLAQDIGHTLNRILIAEAQVQLERIVPDSATQVAASMPEPPTSNMTVSLPRKAGSSVTVSDSKPLPLPGRGLSGQARHHFLSPSSVSKQNLNEDLAQQLVRLTSCREELEFTVDWLRSVQTCIGIERLHGHPVVDITEGNSSLTFKCLSCEAHTRLQALIHSTGIMITHTLPIRLYFSAL